MHEGRGAVRDGKVSKTKRTRVNFTAAQLEAFEMVFSKSQYPDVAVLERLSDGMNLGIEKVCTWFQNRRSKFRRASKKGHIDWMRQHIMAAGGQTNKEETTRPGRLPSEPQNPRVEKSTDSVLSSFKTPKRCYVNNMDFMESSIRQPITSPPTRTEPIPPNVQTGTGTPSNYFPLPGVATYPTMYPTMPCTSAIPSTSASQLPSRDSYPSAASYTDGSNYQLPTWPSHYPAHAQSSPYSYTDYNYQSYGYLNVPSGQTTNYGSHLDLPPVHDSSRNYNVNATYSTGATSSDTLCHTNL